MSVETPNPGPSFAIRITGPTAADLEEAVEYLRTPAGDAQVDVWENGFYEAIRTLSRMPHKHPIAERESRYFGVSVRVLLHERRRGGAAYRVLFTIIEDAPDPPFVRILHVRHGARRSITRREALERLRAIDVDD